MEQNELSGSYLWPTGEEILRMNEIYIFRSDHAEDKRMFISMNRGKPSMARMELSCITNPAKHIE